VLSLSRVDAESPGLGPATTWCCGCFRGTPFEADLRHAIAKLGDALPKGVSVRLDMIADFLSVLPTTRCEYDLKAFNT
jgi:hypothetical protein